MPWCESVWAIWSHISVRAGLDQRLGHLDGRGADGGVDRGLAELGLDLALLRLGEALADVLAQLVERVEAGLGGEVLVELGQLLGLDLLDRDRELGLLAGEVGRRRSRRGTRS